MDEAGIASISVAKTEYSRILPGGNEIADLGSYTRTDGTTGSAGTTAGLADVNLAADTFHRSFTDSIPLTQEVEILPDMHGSGVVRDLREAASTPTSQGSDLTALLIQYASASTRSDQLAQLDSLLIAWGATSGMADMANRAAEHGYAFITNLDTVHQARLIALEQFNGRGFYRFPWETELGQAGVTGLTVDTDAAGQSQIRVNMNTSQIALLDQAWAALRQSVYDGLLLQTRLKPYLDGIDLTIDETGLALDYSGTSAAFQARHDVAPGEAVRDLLDLERIAGTDLTAMGWDGYGQLRSWLATAAGNTDDPTLVPAIVAALGDFGYPGLRTNGNGTSASEVVIGSDAGAVLNGNAGNDLVLGGDGDDTLNGGSGSDVLYGGAGNDTYVFNAGDGADTIIESHGDTGTDTLQFGAGILAGNLDIHADGDKLVFAHANGTDRVSIANWFDSLVADSHRLDTLRFADGKSFDLHALQLGTDAADTLTGTDAGDILVGGAGDDVLNGEAGDDLLYGGTGADTMAGGIGNDIYVVDSALDTVIEATDEGMDTVEARVSHTLSANVENLTLVGTGSTSGIGNELDNTIIGNAGNNALYGLEGDDTLYGGAGNDLLDGGVGADTMSGGIGDDSYVVDTLADTVTELAGQGTDTVYADISYTLGANLENLTLIGSEAVDGVGNELHNTIIGNDAANVLTGLAGNDTLDGRGGADTMLGGIGNDIYVVDNIGDAVIENADEGTDLVKSSITHTLTDNVENLTLTGTATIDGTGNELDNTIIGNDAANVLTGLAGNDLLNGGAGADTMLGGIGNDIYVVESNEDAVIENAEEGTDTVQASISYTLGDNVENLTLTGYGNINGTGNELDNIIIGNGGSNTLDGGLGADSMAGGGGNDTYILDNQGDTVTEQWGQGTDTVLSPFDYTLGANVENLTLTGEALTGTGNELANVIIGTAADNTLSGLDGNDTLDGGAGADTMIGGIGDDTYVVDNLLDTTVELANEGVDTVQSNLTWTLADNLDNMTLTGTEAINGTGNELDNVIIGNTAANTLTGLAGNDTLDGGMEADAMAGGSGVVLDLNGVTDVDLSGLQCICAAHRMSIARQQPFSVCREDNQIIAAMAQAAGYFRHTGCAQDTGHTCIWATGGKQ